MSDHPFKEFRCSKELALNWWKDEKFSYFHIYSLDEKGVLPPEQIHLDKKNSFTRSVCPESGGKPIAFITAKSDGEQWLVEITYFPIHKDQYEYFETMFAYFKAHGASEITPEERRPIDYKKRRMGVFIFWAIFIGFCFLMIILRILTRK